MTKNAGEANPTQAADQNVAGRHRTNDHLVFGITSIVALTASALLVLFTQGSNYRAEILWAWIANLVQAGVAFWINRTAIGAETTRFMILGMGMNFLRVVLLLALIVIVQKTGTGAFYPFLTTALCSFVVFMCGEIIVLHTHAWPALSIRPAAGGEA